jgi:pimeloyl-ACP methyl ester carboxylesterase
MKGILPVKKFTGFIKYLAAFFSRFYRRTVDFLRQFRPGKTALNGAAYGIIAVSASLLVLFSFQFFPYLGIIPVLIVILSIALIAYLGGLLGRLILGMIARVPRALLLAIIAAVIVIGIHFGFSGKTGLPVTVYLLFFASLAGGAAWMVIRKRWRNFKVQRKVKVATFGGVGLAGLLVFSVWLCLPGYDVEMPEIAALKGDYMPLHIELDDPSLPGEFNVLKLTYGSGKHRFRKEYAEEAEIITDSVDGSFFVDGWKGMPGKLRTGHFGFDLKSLPRNGIVWYPDGPGPFPLVLIVHGNHLAQDYSDPGYEYLGNMLASRGYIIVSVDQNFLNGSFTNIFKGLKTENDARGWLLLEHLRLWDEWNSNDSSIFHGKADMQKISLIGHSRGGEAVAHAALFNRLPYYPDNAKVVFDYNFNIRSIVAIAPVDGQYQPAGIRTPLEDISYFVIQGSHDADMQSFLGMRQYERLNFSENFDGFKSALYIYNANHGQFNTGWGRRDYGSPGINLINIRQLMPGQDQRKIAETYISAFLEITLLGNEGYRELFRDWRTGLNWLPETVYLNRYDHPGMQYVCRFSEDLNLVSTTLPGGFIETGNLTVWREQMVKLKWGDKETRAVFIGWNNSENDTLTTCYSVNIPEGSLKTGLHSSLFFSLADANENSNPHPEKADKLGIAENAGEEEEGMDAGEGSDRDPADNDPDDDPDNNADNDADIDVDAEIETENGKRKAIDFSIILGDRNGESIRFRLSDHAWLQPQLEVRMHKLGFMKTTPGSEHLYHFFYFPLERFAGMNEDFLPDAITRITFLFDETEEGVIILDNIGFM